MGKHRRDEPDDDPDRERPGRPRRAGVRGRIHWWWVAPAVLFWVVVGGLVWVNRWVEVPHFERKLRAEGFEVHALEANAPYFVGQATTPAAAGVTAYIDFHINGNGDGLRDGRLEVWFLPKGLRESREPVLSARRDESGRLTYTKVSNSPLAALAERQAERFSTALGR
jgi:hypothetical protein